jgi:acyl-CoA dehydrogenase
VTDRLLLQTAQRIFDDHSSPEAVRAAAREGGWLPGLWGALAGAGLSGVGIAEESGGSGGELADAAALIRLAAQAAAPVPLAEHALLGGWALPAAGLRVPEEPLTAVPEPGVLRAEREGEDWVVSGTAPRVPYGRMAGRVVALCATGSGPLLVSLPLADMTVEEGRNLADEPRDTLSAEAVRLGPRHAAPAPAWLDGLAWRSRGALARSVQIAGALDRVSGMSVQYASERVQFTRPINRFQAVQHLLVRMKEEAVLAGMAADVAVAAAGAASGAQGEGVASAHDIAAAKTVAGRAVDEVTDNAHQIHGAMGMTQEHDLQLFTRRLWSWSAEFGNATAWSQVLADHVAEHGSRDCWPVITAPPGHLPARD